MNYSVIFYHIVMSLHFLSVTIFYPSKYIPIFRVHKLYFEKIFCYIY